MPFYLIDGLRENNDDFIPSEPWNGEKFCDDHVDQGNADSDVEEAVDLITEPRQEGVLLLFKVPIPK
ncbi:hypothetical protein E2562_034903, partial [Oryza meyeriana var. granulata]